MTLKHGKNFSLIFQSKELGLNLFFFVVNNMSHDHDVINRQLLRHGPKSFTVAPKKMNEDIDVKHLAFVFLGINRCFFYYSYLQRLSDSQEISICFKKLNLMALTTEWINTLIFSLSVI